MIFFLQDCNSAPVIAFLYFSVRARGDQAAGEPGEDPGVCASQGQPEENTITWTLSSIFMLISAQWKDAYLWSSLFRNVCLNLHVWFLMRTWDCLFCIYNDVDKNMTCWRCFWCFLCLCLIKSSLCIFLVERPHHFKLQIHSSHIYTHLYASLFLSQLFILSVCSVWIIKGGLLSLDTDPSSGNWFACGSSPPTLVALSHGYWDFNYLIFSFHHGTRGESTGHLVAFHRVEAKNTPGPG